MPQAAAPSAVAWTAPRDAQLRRLRLEGATWAEIGALLAITADMARERGRRIGAPRPPTSTGGPRPEDPARAPLPPGHPRSWALLTDGTLLAGLGWPGAL